MLKPKVGFCVTMHPLEEGTESAPGYQRDAAAALSAAGLEVVSAPEIVQDDRTSSLTADEFRRADVDLLCVLEATWSADHIVTDILQVVDVPVVTWAQPGVDTGSLCGCQQLDCVLTELGKTYRFVYGSVGDSAPLKEIVTFARAAALQRRLRTSRLGLIGYRIPGMTEVAFDELELRSVFGPRVVHVGISDLLSVAESMPGNEAAEVWESAKAGVGKVDVPDRDGLHSAKVYLAYKKLAEEYGLSGFATECYPDLMGQVCLAHSLLAEEGVVTACEGDMNSALATLVLAGLTDQPVHNTDLLAIYEDDDSVLLSHCGSGGFSIARSKDDITLASVRLAGTGVCVLFPGRPGPVTMVNLVGRKETYRMCAVTGEAIETPMVFAGNPLRVSLPIGVRDMLALIADEGFGHHWMVGYGDVRSELEELARLADIRFVGVPA